MSASGAPAGSHLEDIHPGRVKQRDQKFDEIATLATDGDEDARFGVSG
jgi:hypothetical protein